MKEMFLEEIQEAKANLEHAKILFNMAKEEYFEIANLQLQIAEMRYDLAYRKMRQFLAENLGESREESWWSKFKAKIASEY